MYNGFSLFSFLFIFEVIFNSVFRISCNLLINKIEALKNLIHLFGSTLFIPILPSPSNTPLIKCLNNVLS